MRKGSSPTGGLRSIRFWGTDPKIGHSSDGLVWPRAERPLWSGQSGKPPSPNLDLAAALEPELTFAEISRKSDFDPSLSLGRLLSNSRKQTFAVLLHRQDLRHARRREVQGCLPEADVRNCKRSRLGYRITGGRLSHTAAYVYFRKSGDTAVPNSMCLRIRPTSRAALIGAGSF